MSYVRALVTTHVSLFFFGAFVFPAILFSFKFRAAASRLHQHQQQQQHEKGGRQLAIEHVTLTRHAVNAADDIAVAIQLLVFQDGGGELGKKLTSILKKRRIFIKCRPGAAEFLK